MWCGDLMFVRVLGVGGMDFRMNDWIFYLDEYVFCWWCFIVKMLLFIYCVVNLIVLYVMWFVVLGSRVRGGYWRNDFWYIEIKDMRYRWFRFILKCLVLSVDIKCVYL